MATETVNIKVADGRREGGNSLCLKRMEKFGKRDYQVNYKEPRFEISIMLLALKL